MKIQYMIWFLILLIFLTTCGTGSGVDNTPAYTTGSVRIGGKLGTDYNFSTSASADSRSISSAVTHIGAFSVIIGSLEELSIAEVNEVNEFNIDVPPEENGEHVLMLLNEETESIIDRVLGCVSIRMETETLIDLPVDSGNAMIDLGELTKEGNEALSDIPPQVSAELFNMSEAELSQRAYHDNMLKNARNTKMNEDSGYVCQFWYTWLDYEDYINVQNNWYDVTEVGEFASYHIELRVPTLEFNYSLIKNQSQEIKLFPPTGIVGYYGVFDDTLSPPDWTYHREEYGPEKPISTVHPVNKLLPWMDVVDNFYYTPFTSVSATDWENNPDKMMITFNTGTNVPKEYAATLPENEFIIGLGEIPEGDWLLKKDDDDTILAAYDFSLLDPMGENDHPIILIPSVKYVFTEEELSGFMVKFMCIDRDGTAYEAESESVEKIINHLFFSIQGEGMIYSGNPGNFRDGNIFNIPASAMSVTTGYGTTNRQMGVQYNVLGVRVAFGYFFM